MIENPMLRARARDTLEHRLFGNVWITLLVASLIYSIIVSIPSSIGTALPGYSKYYIGWIFSIGTIVLSGPMGYGITRMFVKTARGDKKIDYMDLFIGFKEDFQNTLLLGLLRGIFVFLWSLLLIVPGVIKAYAYSMSSYIQQDSEDKEWRKCLDLSSEMMYGYKWKLFLLDLSFIGWYIVGLLCLGVGVLWVNVYHSMAKAHFYEELKEVRKDLFPQTEIADNAEDSAPVFEEEKTEDAANENTIFLEAAPIIEDAEENADEEK